MAQDKFSTTLQPIGEFNAYVDKPVINEAPATKAKNILTTLAKGTQIAATAYDSYKDYEAKVDVGEEILDEIDLYKNTSQSWNSLPFVKDQNKNMETNENQILLNNELSKLDGQIKKETDALAQNKVTPFQSKMRIKAVLQEAIKNSPGRADVITKYSQELLNNAGINILYTEDKALASATAADLKSLTNKYQNYVISQSIKHDKPLIYLPGTKTIDFSATEAGFQEDMITLDKKDAINYKNEIRDGKQDEALNYAVDKGWDTALLLGISQDIRTFGLELFPDNEDPVISAQEFPKRINTLLTYIDQQEYDLMTREDGTGRTFGSFMDNDIIKTKFEVFQKQLTNYRNRVRSWRDGTDVKKGLENVVASKKSIDQAEIYKFVSQFELDALDKLIESKKALGTRGQNTPAAKRLDDQILRTVAKVSGGFNSLDINRNYPQLTDYYVNEEAGVVPFVNVTNSLVNDLKNLENNSVQKRQIQPVIKEHLNGVGKSYLNLDNVSLTNRQAFQSFDNLTNIVLDPNNKKVMDQLPKGATVTDKEIPIYAGDVNRRVSKAVTDNLNRLDQSVLPLTALNLNLDENNRLSVTFKNVNDFPPDMQKDVVKAKDSLNQLFNYINKQFDYHKWANAAPNASFDAFMEEYYPNLPGISGVQE